MYVRNTTIHRDLQIPTIRQFLKEETEKNVRHGRNSFKSTTSRSDQLRSRTNSKTQDQR